MKYQLLICFFLFQTVLFSQTLDTTYVYKLLFEQSVRETSHLGKDTVVVSYAQLVPIDLRSDSLLLLVSIVTSPAEDQEGLTQHVRYHRTYNWLPAHKFFPLSQLGSIIIPILNVYEKRRNHNRFSDKQIIEKTDYFLKNRMMDFGFTPWGPVVIRNSKSH